MNSFFVVAFIFVASAVTLARAGEKPCPEETNELGATLEHGVSVSIDGNCYQCLDGRVSIVRQTEHCRQQATKRSMEEYDSNRPYKPRGRKRSILHRRSKLDEDIDE